MDHIIPAIDLTGSMAAVQAGRQGGGGGNLLGDIFRYIFYPSGVKSKGHIVLCSLSFYYRCYFYGICPDLLVNNQKTFSSFVFSPHTGVGGGSWTIVTNLLWWPCIYCVAPLSVFGNQGYFHTMIVLVEKLNRSSRVGATNWSIYFGWRDLVFISQEKRERSSE